jgi:hypothetical protein
MTLEEVRAKFCELSGRHDLVVDFANEDYTDNGADFYLNNGQKFLDGEYTGIKRYSWHKEDVSLGTYKIKFRRCDAIKEVWVKKSGESRVMLAKRDYSWIRKQYGDDYSDLDNGIPVNYCSLILNLEPDQIDLTTLNYTNTFTQDVEDILFSNTASHHLYSGILILPPVDGIYTISVLGRFWSPPLYPNADDDLETFWTVAHPDTLILAGMFSLEGFYRNTEGQKDYLVQINKTLNILDANDAEDEAQDIDQMEG